MTDKVQKIREEVVRMHNLLPIMDGDNISVNYADRICTILEMYIDSMHEEPVSEDLDKFATQSANKLYPPEYEMADDNWKQRAGYVKGCKDGAKWQKQQLMAKAIDVEVHIEAGNYPYVPQIELYDYDKDIPLAKEGDKYKVILIKEDLTCR